MIRDFLQRYKARSRSVRLFEYADLVVRAAPNAVLLIPLNNYDKFSVPTVPISVGKPDCGDAAEPGVPLDVRDKRRLKLSVRSLLNCKKAPQLPIALTGLAVYEL